MADIDTDQIKPDINEKSLEWSDIEGLHVFNEEGTTLPFGDLYANRKSIIVFVRYTLGEMVDSHISGYIHDAGQQVLTGIMNVMMTAGEFDLAKIPQKSLDDANVRLIVIGCAKHTFIKNFRKVTGYNHEMYSDPSATVYSKLGMIRTLATASSGSEHVRSSVMAGFASSIWRTMKSMGMQGDVKQQGGQLVLGPGHVVKYIHIDSGTLDHTPINKLLSMANVATVDFSQK